MIQRISKIFIAVLLCITLLMTGCAKNNTQDKGNNSTGTENNGELSNNQENDNSGNNENKEISTEENGTGGNNNADENNSRENEANKPAEVKEPVDIEKIRPNENGKIMIVMFHNFVETFTPTKYDDGQYTTTFDEFRKLLQDLYDRNYRLISMEDYLNNNISVPAGCIPMVFTFDDGTAGQFNLIEQDGQLVANPKSAVGILEEFNKTHPDFGTKGVFYINFNSNTFSGKGTMEERLKYLIDKGFEIGNHTLSHVNLKTDIKNAQELQKEIGENNKRLSDLIPGCSMDSIALPFGLHPAKDLWDYVLQGEYEGVVYKNQVVLEVGAEPAYPSTHVNFKAISTPRVRSNGINPVQCDLNWWLERLSRDEQYISDGDPNTITVPKAKEGEVNKEKLNGKQLVTY